MIRPSTIAQIRDNADIRALIEETVPLKDRNHSVVGTCPFCHGTDALHVSPHRKFFHCFGCKESGSAIDWVMKTENVDFASAVKRLQGHDPVR